MFGSNFGAIPNTFGSNSTSAFGASTNLFGQSNQTSSQTSSFSFGNIQKSQTSIFGSTASNNVMGNNNNQGSGNPPFAALEFQETPGSTNFFQTISAMTPYKNFSLEEIRFQDYLLNKKFSANSASFGARALNAFEGNAFGNSGSTSSSTNSSFGGPNAFQSSLKNTNSFGSSTGAFGINSAFGNTSNFGSSSFNPSSSAFGSAITSDKTSNAGAVGAFATSSNSSFGSNMIPAFGSFGTSAPSFGTGAFGGGNTQSFGNTTPSFGGATAPAFGSSSFGSSAPTFGTSGFGNTSSFGASSSLPFGMSTSTPFGSTTPAFGSTTTPFGSTAVQSNSTPSFGSAATSAFGSNTSSAFGSNTSSAFRSNTSSAFGSNAAPTFGSNNTPAFGTNTTSAFGSNTTPAFGSNVTSAFGSNTAPAFGSNTAPAFGSITTPAFGSDATSTLGSNTRPAFGGSNNATVFGSNPTLTPGSISTPAFGGTSTTTFGSSATTTATLFGSSSTPAFGTANSFVSTTAPAFVSTTSTFGSSTPAFESTTPAFGYTAIATPASTTLNSAFKTTSTTTPAFGSATFNAPSSASTTFGTPQNTSTFGINTTSTEVGQQQVAPSSGFVQSSFIQPPSKSLFGQTEPSTGPFPFTPAATNANITTNPTSENGKSSSIQALDSNQSNINQQNSLVAQIPSLVSENTAAVGSSKFQPALNSSTLTNSVATNSGKDNASKDSTQNITATVDSLNFTQIKSSSVPATFNSKVAASEDTKAVAPEADTSQIKSLGIKLEDVPKLNNTADDLNSAKQVRKTPPYKVQDAFADKSSSQSPLINPREVLSVSEIGLLVLKSDKSTATPPQPFRMTPKSSAKLKLRGISQSPISVTSNIQHTNKSYNSKNGGLELETLSESLKEVEETFILSKSNEMDSLSTTHPKASQVYEVKPNISELKKMRDEELKCVENFEVSVPKVGKIKWLQPVDILKIVKSGNGIESIFEDEIIIEQNSATVYPNANTKPNVGSELNTPCLITLFNMWPKDRSNMIAIKDLKDFRMENYLRRLKSVPDTKFKNYDVNLGAWTFVVQHFTKYGFDDDASEMETEEFGNDSSYAINDSFANIKSRKGKQREKVHHLVYHENILDDLENNSNFLEGAKNEKKHLETFFGDEVIISKINEETDDFEEDEEQVDMYEEQPNNRSEFNDINLAIENEGFEADLLEDGIAVDESDESEDLSEQQVADEDGAHSASPSDTPQSEKSLKRMLQTKLSVPHSFKAVKVQQMGQAFFRKEVQIKTPITSKRSEAVALQEDSDIADNGSVALTKYLERDAENKPKTPFNKRYTPVATTPSLSELRLFEKSSSDHLNMQNFYKRMENIQGGSPYKINFTKKNQIPVIQKGYLQKRFNNGKVIKSMEGILDGSLSFGRSFRVGWGRAGQLITCGSLDHGRNNVNFSLVNIVKLDVFNDQLLELEKLKHEKLLNCLLRHTFINRVKLDENKYASADPKNVNDTILNQPAENFDFAVSINSAVGFKDLAGEVSNVLNNSTNVSVHTIFDEQEKVLWDLCSALWDTTDLDNELTASLNEKQIVATNESSRKEDVSGWLKNALKANVNKLVQEAKQKEDSSKIIFSLLSGREIGRATMEAIFAKNFKLSLILSQIGGPSSRVGRNSEYGPSGHGAPGRMGTDEALRELIAKQVEIWEKIKHDIVAFNKSKVVFNEELFCCWKLISGIFKDADIFSIIKQDWKRTFGCFLWYGDGGLWSLKKAFQSFCSLVESGRNVSYPYPKYIETLSASEQAIVLNKIKGLTGVDTAPKDSIYNILKFYSVQDFKIEEALKPEGFSINLLDVRQPWFLSTFLSHRRDSVEGSKQLPNNVENYLAVSFAFELESLGLWKYCCFVAMFLNNIVEKERMIKYYLSKFFDYKDFSSSCARDFFEDSLKKDDSEEFRFLVKKLRIPLNWIFEAKILKARNANDVFFEVTALIDAGYYSAAHRTILLKVAPFAVINSDYVILEKLLALIQGRKIDCWEIGGSILLQFIKIENFTNDYLNKFDMLDDNLNNLKNSLSEEDFFEEMRKYDIRKRTLIVELKEKFSVKEVLNLCFKSLIKQKRDMVLKKKFLFVNGSNTAYSIKELKSNLLHLTAVFTEINSKLAALIFKLDNHIPNFKDEIDMGEIQSLSLNGHERLSIYNYQFSSFINESLEK